MLNALTSWLADWRAWGWALVGLAVLWRLRLHIGVAICLIATIALAFLAACAILLT